MISTILLRLLSGYSDQLLKHSMFVKDSLYKLKQSCCDFLTRKKHFLHGMYEAWNEAMMDMENFFYAERLSKTAWHLIGRQKDCKFQQFFVSEFINLRNIFDTKESKFFFR